MQQGLYGSHFTRCLCALMSNLPDNETVLRLSENLFEELGLDGGGSVPHHVIYQRMLESFGLSMTGAKPTAATQRMIDTALGYCRNPNPAYGLGAISLGAEALVPVIYADLIAGFGACGIPAEQIRFFHIHVECDDGHAETLRDIMVDVARNDLQQVHLMIEAGQAMVDARMALFSAVDAHFDQGDAGELAAA